MKVADKIREARSRMGFTQEQAAEKLLVSRQTISNWENGKSLPDIVSIIRMSELYDLTVDELLKGDAGLMKKIERDSGLARREKKFLRAAFIALVISVVLLVLGYVFEGNPVFDFINGALPWVLLGLLGLYVTLNFNQEEVQGKE